MGARGFRSKPVAPVILAAAKAREDDFLAAILPAVRRHAARRFRGLPHWWREECHQEAAAGAWQLFVTSIAYNRDPLKAIGTLAHFAVLQVFRHRYLTGEASRTCALSRNAQERGAFRSFTGTPLDRPALSGGRRVIRKQIHDREDNE